MIISNDFKEPLDFVVFGKKDAVFKKRNAVSTHKTSIAI